MRRLQNSPSGSPTGPSQKDIESSGAIPPMQGASEATSAASRSRSVCSVFTSPPAPLPTLARMTSFVLGYWACMKAMCRELLSTQAGRSSCSKLEMLVMSATGGGV